MEGRGIEREWFKAERKFFLESRGDIPVCLSQYCFRNNPDFKDFTRNIIGMKMCRTEMKDHESVPHNDYTCRV